MHREVEINGPMFIGIILLVAAVTTILVCTVNAVSSWIWRDNQRMDAGFEHFEGEVENRTNGEINESVKPNIVI